MLYGWAMSDPLKKNDWLKHGLLTLSQQGHEGLKADTMAKTLNVSRGSFYWHFENLNCFKTALHAYWCERTTRQIIEDMDAHVTQERRLETLMRTAFGSNSDLERSMRAWAAQNDGAADAVRKVDDERLNYLTTLLVDAGVGLPAASHRAIFIYRAYLGRVMTPELDTDGSSDDALRELLALLVPPNE